MEEGAIGLIGLRHHELTLPHYGIRFEVVDNATNNDGWIKPMRMHECADYACGSGFAMSAGNSDAAAQTHKLSQHEGSFDDGNSAKFCASKLNVIGWNRR